MTSWPMPFVRFSAFPAAACAAALLLTPGVACAADLPNNPSTYPALTTNPGEPAWNPWSGLYVGTGVSAWGGKGVKGGVGGEGYLGYDHAFDNGVVVGVRASSGYAPFLWSAPNGFSQFTGTAYAGGSAVVGYQMGQLTPYVIAGVDLARPTRFGSFSALDNVNAVFSGPGAVQAIGTVGVGAIYRFNNNFSFGVEALVHTTPAGAWGWPY
jgi:outer membrane immunogenic protein